MVYCKINKIILNQIYKFFLYALQFDPPQPPFKRGEKKKPKVLVLGFVTSTQPTNVYNCGIFHSFLLNLIE